METRRREILKYETAGGRVPFADWMDTLEGRDIWGIILNRLDRVQEGLLGDVAPVGKGVFELRIHHGPGYRVYFGQDGDFIILLCGGTKKTQAADISRAQEFWREYHA